MIKDGWECRSSFLIWVVGDSGCFSHRRILVINPWRRYEPPHHWPNPTPTQNDDWVLNVALVLYSICYRWWHVDQRFRGFAGTVSIFVLWRAQKNPLAAGFRGESLSSLGVWQAAISQLCLLGCIKTSTLKLHVLFAAIGQGHLRFLRNPGPRSVAWRVCASQMWGERCVDVTTSFL